jgi:GMP synthase (glutamine-hydrolysing)
MSSAAPPPPRLKAEIWVQAALRSCGAAAIMATVARRGDTDAGIVLLKQNLLGNGFVVLTPMRASDGELGWIRGTGAQPVSEPEADSYIARQVNRDSDLWVIEIEDRNGILPFPHRLLES